MSRSVRAIGFREMPLEHLSGDPYVWMPRLRNNRVQKGTTKIESVDPAGTDEC